MRKVILFISTSVDGFIAKKDRGVDWLCTDEDYGFQKFQQTIDTTLMGNTTYKQVVNFGCNSIFSEKNFVFSREKHKDTNEVEFITEDIPKFVLSLKQKHGKDIWLIGGSEINTLLIRNNLIDEIVVNIHPVILGEGIPIFANSKKEKKLHLRSQHIYKNGLIQASYTVGKN